MIYILSKEYDNALPDELFIFRKCCITMQFSNNNSMPTSFSVNCYPTFDLYNIQEIKIDSLGKKINSYKFPDFEKIYLIWKNNQMNIKLYIFNLIFSLNKRIKDFNQHFSANFFNYSKIQNSIRKQVIAKDILVFTKEIYFLNIELISQITSFFVFYHGNAKELIFPIIIELKNIIHYQNKLLRLMREYSKFNI